MKQVQDIKIRCKICKRYFKTENIHGGRRMCPGCRGGAGADLNDEQLREDCDIAYPEVNRS